MKITVEIEPVILHGNLSDARYYGFKIVDGPKNKFGGDVIYHCPDSVYPGNDSMREFFNLKQQTVTGEQNGTL